MLLLNEYDNIYDILTILHVFRYPPTQMYQAIVKALVSKYPKLKDPGPVKTEYVSSLFLI